MFSLFHFVFTCSRHATRAKDHRPFYLHNPQISETRKTDHMMGVDVAVCCAHLLDLNRSWPNVVLLVSFFSPADCRDAYREAPYCSEWKTNGFCEKYKGQMDTYCPKTCGLCGNSAYLLLE